jgi:hypothetical protein
MYKVMSKDYPNELWATGFYSKEKAQGLIDKGYFQKYMYEKDKIKKLVVIKY